MLIKAFKSVVVRLPVLTIARFSGWVSAVDRKRYLQRAKFNDFITDDLFYNYKNEHLNGGIQQVFPQPPPIIFLVSRLHERKS